MFVVFFFKQKTAYEMRISDWSSDVCSSDLNLYVGGLDTVTANIGLHIWHLATHLDQQAELRADPSKLTLAIEEMMRAYAAVTTFRTVTRATEFKGVKMMPGDKVAMSTAITSKTGRASCRERLGPHCSSCVVRVSIKK